jgi:large subunit ribosomal protein L21
VSEGQTIDVERIDVADGSTVELDRVLMVADGDKVAVGNPVVEGAKVMATAKENGKGDKVIVFKYKAKVRYRRKNGHRQQYTRLSIDSITATGIAEAKPVKTAKAAKPAKATKPAEAAKPAPAKKTTRRKKKEETADGA